MCMASLSVAFMNDNVQFVYRSVPSLDPNVNYTYLEHILVKSLDDHIAYVKMNFNKHRHKNSD